MNNNEPVGLTQCKTIDEREFAALRASVYAMEPKIDGWRIQMDVDDNSIVSWTRTNHLATGKALEAESYVQHHIPNVRLDGEMVYLDSTGRPDYNWTARVLGSGKEVAIEKQYEANKHLTYVVFDILRHFDDDLRGQPYEARRKLLATIPEGPYLKVIPIAEPSMDQHLQNLEMYDEGSVLKQLNAPYAGKRHKSWLKWKYQPTVDAQIIGYKPGQGKYDGLIGAIHFRSEDGVEGYCSGMDDETRVSISDLKEGLIDSWIEIKHFGKLVDGYRHPQFLRFRPDKGL